MCWHLPVQHEDQNCEFFAQVKNLDNVLDVFQDDQPPAKYVRLNDGSPYGSPNTQAQALTTSPSSTDTQVPCSSSYTGKVSPFPTPSRKHDSLLVSRNSDEYFWSRENSSGSEQESPWRHGEMPENARGKAELELSLAGLDCHRPTSPTSSLTDDETLPP